MNILEKILEEMENESKLAHEEMRRCARGNPLQFDEVKGYARAMEYVVDTIRSHMDEVSGMRGKRLIDANALAGEVMNLSIAITGNPNQATVVRECKESFRRMIDEQPTVYEASDWIPVEDKQAPEKEVIAQNVYDEMMIGYVYYSEEMEWYECVSDDVYLTNVVAWQPRPKSYKKHRQ